MGVACPDETLGDLTRIGETDLRTAAVVLGISTDVSGDDGASVWTMLTGEGLFLTNSPGHNFDLGGFAGGGDLIVVRE